MLNSSSFSNMMELFLYLHFEKNVSLFEKGLYLVLLKHLKLQNILRVTFAFRRYFLKLTNVSFSMHDQCSRYLNQVPTLHD